MRFIRTRRWVRGTAVVLSTAAACVGAWPAAANDAGPLIQPGAAAWLGHTPFGPYTPCTLNFVFRDERDTYIGTAARCTYKVGERATMAGREFGTVVFRAFTGSEELVPSATNPSSIDDFALIRVDRRHWHRVSPVVAGIGRSPNGFTRSGSTPDNDLVFMTGQGIGMSHAGAQTRPGLLTTDDARGFRILTPATPGDLGAPVVLHTWEAVGVLSANGVPAPFGTTVERILVLLREAGYRVELVTTDAQLPASKR